MNTDFSAIIANDALCSYFSDAIRSSSLSHAYILLGDKGTGKRTLALQIAAALNCDAKADKHTGIPCGRCPSCRKILSRDSADVTFISREKDRATLGVESVRFIKNDVSVYPNDKDYKIYIIEDAHTMTPQAQNALLLTLEEPPPYVVFILLCEVAENILETIKSRAPILRMKIPTKSEAMRYISSSSSAGNALINRSPEEFNELYVASEGSIGKLLSLINSSEGKNVLQERQKTKDIIEAIASKTLSSSFSQILSQFSQKRDERERVIEQLTQMQIALRDIMAMKKSDNAPLLFFADREYAEELSYSFSTKRLSDIIECAEKAKGALQRNANVKLTVTSFLSELI